jgi:CRP-like cAMP-binding protein
MASSEAQPASNLPPAFLASIPRHETAVILAAAQPKNFGAKRVIITAGDPAAHLFLIRSGRVKYFRSTSSGVDIIFQWLTPGDVFGLGTLLKRPFEYIGSAEAMENCEVLVWNHASIRSLAELYPQLAENALIVIQRYMLAYVERQVSFSEQNAGQRLAGLLLDLGNRTGRVSPYGVEIDATNEQLSGLADMTPFTASRWLSKWQRQGAVSKKRGKIVIHAPETLLVE